MTWPHADQADDDAEERRAATARHAGRRRQILDAATPLLNDRGVSGMTFADVARSLSLTTTSINYYFGSKQALVATVFSDGLDQLESLADEAARGSDPRDRVRRYITLYLAWFRRAAAGEARPFANLSEIRTLDEPLRQALLAHYQRIFRSVRGFFGGSDAPPDKNRDTARAHLLNETLFWAERWLGRYAPTDIDGVADRLFAILDGGVAPSSPAPASHPVAIDAPSPPRRGGEESFLPVTTRLINDHGYRGASIERIVAELRVTKGSFYHHLAAKDDLVLQCFRRSYERTMALMLDIERTAPTAWAALGDALATLVDIQFASPFPLTRSSALQAVPQPVRTAALALLERTALHLGGLLVGGMRDGSIRLIDPTIASQFLLSAVNASYDIRNWAGKTGLDTATPLYVSAVQHGLFDSAVC